MPRMAWYRGRPTAGTASTLPFRSVDEQRIASQFQPGNVIYWRPQLRRWREIVPQESQVSIANGYWMMLDASQAISAEHRGPDGYTLDVLDFTE